MEVVAARVSVDGGHTYRPDVLHRIDGLIQAAKAEERRAPALAVWFSSQGGAGEHAKVLGCLPQAVRPSP